MGQGCMVGSDACAPIQAQLLVESAGAMKSRGAREGAFAMLATCALRYGQLEAVAGALVAALPRNEHLGTVLPELAEYAEARHGDASLVMPTLTQQPHDVHDGVH